MVIQLNTYLGVAVGCFADVVNIYNQLTLIVLENLGGFIQSVERL